MRTALPGKLVKCLDDVLRRQVLHIDPRGPCGRTFEAGLVDGHDMVLIQPFNIHRDGEEVVRHPGRHQGAGIKTGTFPYLVPGHIDVCADGPVEFNHLAVLVRHKISTVRRFHRTPQAG